MERTLVEIKKAGLDYQIVEHWNPYSKRRIDLFGIIDLLVLDNGIVGYQVCGADYQPHIKKITEDEKEKTIKWLNSNGRLEIWSWRKLKKVRGMKAMEWKPRIADVLIVNGELYLEERE